jgi:hypothetical protein
MMMTGGKNANRINDGTMVKTLLSLYPFRPGVYSSTPPPLIQLYRLLCALFFLVSLIFFYFPVCVCVCVCVKKYEKKKKKTDPKEKQSSKRRKCGMRIYSYLINVHTHTQRVHYKVRKHRRSHSRGKCVVCFSSFFRFFFWCFSFGLWPLTSC